MRSADGEGRRRRGDRGSSTRVTSSYPLDRDHSSPAVFASCGSFDFVLDRVRSGRDLRPNIDSTHCLMTILLYAIIRVAALTNSN
jgi:hypothetical protein